MEIVLCTDENYAVGCGVCICSIARHNNPEECHFHVLTSNLSEKSKARFAEIAKTYGCTVELIDVDNQIFNNLTISKRFPISIYYRYLAPQLLQCDKSLYFDCDIIVRGSIKELWETDISNYPLAAVEDQAYGYDPTFFVSHIGNYTHRYFNSGVLLINHKYWREHNTIATLTKSIEEHPTFTFADQDALNYVFRDKVLLLSHKFNYQSDWVYGKITETTINSGLHTSVDNAPVIHFCYSTPWIFGKFHPLSHLFFNELELSPWRNYILAYHSEMRGGKLAILLKPFWLFDRIFKSNKGARWHSFFLGKMKESIMK